MGIGRGVPVGMGVSVGTPGGVFVGLISGCWAGRQPANRPAAAAILRKFRRDNPRGQVSSLRFCSFDIRLSLSLVIRVDLRKPASPRFVSQSGWNEKLSTPVRAAYRSLVSSQYSGASGLGSHAYAPTPAPFGRLRAGFPHVGRERAAPATSPLWGGLEGWTARWRRNCLYRPPPRLIEEILFLVV